jgi:hypothetical protein
VEANASYEDPSTSKSRELDIFAMNTGSAGPGEHDRLFAVLLIECVNNPEPLTLITKEPLVPQMHHYDVRVSGLPVKFPDRDSDSWLSLADFLGLDKFHHYCRGRVATQYCSFQKKRNAEWMAWHDEEHFDSFRKLSDAMDYAISKHFENWVIEEPESINLQVYYPVLLLQGGLWEARPSRRSVRLSKAQHLQLRRSITAQGEEREYQIDIITERHLPTYIRLIAAEADRIRRRLKRRRDDVRKAVDRITAAAKTASDTSARRAAMDF